MTGNLTSFPSEFRSTFPSTVGDFRASACPYSGPTGTNEQKSQKRERKSTIESNGKFDTELPQLLLYLFLSSS